MQNITIIGLGLIGGSIGLALKRWSAENGNALHLVGFDDDMDKQARAKRMGAVDDTQWSLGSALSDADIVIVATPVGAMKDVFDNIGDKLKQGAIVTDTGSTKSDVLRWSATLPDHVNFVGGHPMAGRAESLEAADADLFKGATWVVCPSPRASEAAIQNVLGIVGATGAEAYFVDPAEHDAYVAGVSHLPFVLAASLVNAVTDDQSWRDMKSLASSGFRDTTRLALGSPAMHRDILLTNGPAVARWIDQMVESLTELRTVLVSDGEDKAERLFEFFDHAQDQRALAELSPNRAAEQHQISAKAEMGSMSDQMGRMLLGGFGKRRRGDKRGS